MEKIKTGGEQVTEVMGKTTHKGDIWMGNETHFQSLDHCGSVLIIFLVTWSCVNVLCKELYVKKLDIL